MLFGKEGGDQEKGPIPDVICTKGEGRPVRPPTEKKAGPCHTHLALIWIMVLLFFCFFAPAWAIPF